MRPLKHLTRAILAVLLLAPLAHARPPLGTAFTYQGELADAGQRVTGTYDFIFTLFSEANGAVQTGLPICADNVAVVDGRFTVKLDFAGVIYNGQGAYLRISVRPDTGLDCSTTTGFTDLAPLQELTATPGALFALQSGNAGTLAGQSDAFYLNATNLIAGTLGDARLSTNVSLLQTPQTFSGPKTFANNNFLLRNTTNTFSTALTAPSASVARTIALPNVDGTVITTGNLSSITSVGTLTSGTWNASPITLAFGGTNANLSATGGANQIVKQSAVGAPFSVGLLSPADIPATSGDLSGAYLNATVARLQGRTVAATAPTDTQVLKWNASLTRWEPAADLNTTYTAGSGLSLAGSTFSIATGGVSGGAGGVIADATITSADLASDAASLAKVSASAMQTTAGRVGIGIAPAVGKELHVNGDVQVDGTITIPATTRTVVISPMDFIVTDTNSRHNYFPQAGSTSAPYISHNIADGALAGGAAPVHLPVGATITGITVYYSDADNAAGDNITFTLRRTPFGGTGGSTDVVSFSSFGVTTGVDATSQTGLSEVVSANAHYWLAIVWPTATIAVGDVKFYGATITYTVTQPLP